MYGSTKKNLFGSLYQSLFLPVPLIYNPHLKNKFLNYPLFTNDCNSPCIMLNPFIYQGFLSVLTKTIYLLHIFFRIYTNIEK